MKTVFKLLVLLFCVTAFAQEQKQDQKVTFETINNDLVKATYYFADNADVIQREGYFNKEGKLHGEWINYDLAGNKTVIANYNNGVKDGVWTYFKQDKINLVTYKANKILQVEEKVIVAN